MNDPRFDPALRLYDIADDIEKNIQNRFGSGANGMANNLNTHVRDTVRAQVAILRNVASTLNVLSNTMYEAEKGYLVVLPNKIDEGKAVEGKMKVLTSAEYRNE